MRLLLLGALVLLLPACNDTAAGADGGTGGGTATGGGATGGGTATGGGSTGGGNATGGGATGGGTASSGGGVFLTSGPWNKDVSTLPVSAESATIIGQLTSMGGWGSNTFRTDDSIHVLDAPAGTPRVTVVGASTYYLPDCEPMPSTMPLPTVGATEGETGYACTGGGDCHLLVLSGSENKLYELYQGNQLANGTVETACLVVWDLTKHYPDTLRGEQCTSTDAAGLPVSAFMVNANEVFAGEVPHALRFILPNARMQAGVYVHPATHAGGPSGPASAPPYGVRFRLKASFDETRLTAPGARVIAKALKKYGMVLSDGGNIPVTIQSDRFTTHKWSEVGIVDSTALSVLTPADFEVVDLGTRIPLTYDCVRNP